jgi:hypothetical protein
MNLMRPQLFSALPRRLRDGAVDQNLPACFACHSAQPSLKATIPPPAGAVFKGSGKH